MVQNQDLHQLEQDILTEVSGAQLMDYARMAAQGIRLSGSPDERTVFLEIKSELERLGFTCQLLEHMGYVSWPLESSVTVEGSGEVIGPSITHAMAASTSAEGLVGELVYVGAGEYDAYRKTDVRGKIVVLEGLAMPGIVTRAEEHGCLATICISDEYLHQLIVSTVWGNPTPETAGFLPKTPTVSIRADAGQRLRDLMEQGPVRVRLRTRVDTSWKRLPLLVADMPAPRSPDSFVFVSSHVDSWFYGAMDNGAANATALEMARLLAKRQAHWQRGLRLAFWSGHSHGRFCGSAWYADQYWEDLNEHGVVHVYVDSTGGKGANDLRGAQAMAETRALAAAAVREVTGQEIIGRRVGRAGDQSFWGIGLPSIFITVSEQPPGGSDLAAQLGRMLGGTDSGGLGWWWHSEHDTIDKVDEENLVRDTKVYVLSVARFLLSPVLPFNYADVADEFVTLLEGFEEKVGNVLDLSPALDRAHVMQKKAHELQQAAARIMDTCTSSDEAAAMQVNECFRKLARLLVPVNYSAVDRFDQSRAHNIRPIPTLQPVTELARLEPDSHEFRILETRLVRERNKICHALVQARQVIEDTLARL